MVSACQLTVHVSGMLVWPVPSPHVGGGRDELQVMSSRLVVTSAQGINTRPLQYNIMKLLPIASYKIILPTGTKT